MTPERCEAIEKGTADLTPEEIRQGWHFCWDWDGLLVGPGMGELRHCSCLPTDHLARAVPVPDEHLERWPHWDLPF